MTDSTLPHDPQRGPQDTLRGTVCPSTDEWLNLMCGHDDGAESGTARLSRQPELAAHLESCGSCQAAVSDVRRYQTLLLRARPPGLSTEQRQSLEDRVRLMAGQWNAPPRISPKLAWGLAMAAAAALALVVARPFFVASDGGFDKRLSEATLPTAERPGPGLTTGAVDGGPEIADRDGRWRRLTAGEALRAGMLLRAPAGSTARVVVPGRFELRLQATSELEVLSMHASEAHVRLRQGEVACQVDKLRPGQRFAVMFAGFRASVVGTRFTVHNPGTGGVSVQVTEGAVRVDAADEPNAPPAETMTMVRAGHRWQFSGGVMALEPIPAPFSQVPQAPALSPVVEQPAKLVPVVPAEPANGAAGPVRPPAKAAPSKEATAEPAAKARQIVIEVPPQKMTADDLEKLEHGGKVEEKP